MGDHAKPARAATFCRAGVGGLIGQSAPMHLLHDLIALRIQSEYENSSRGAMVDRKIA